MTAATAAVGARMQTANYHRTHTHTRPHTDMYRRVRYCTVDAAAESERRVR